MVILTIKVVLKGGRFLIVCYAKDRVILTPL